MKAFEYTGRKDSDPDKLSQRLWQHNVAESDDALGDHTKPRNAQPPNEGGDASMAEVLL
jgi:hypothetical protein